MDIKSFIDFLDNNKEASEILKSKKGYTEKYKMAIIDSAMDVFVKNFVDEYGFMSKVQFDDFFTQFNSLTSDRGNREDLKLEILKARKKNEELKKLLYNEKKKKKIALKRFIVIILIALSFSAGFFVRQYFFQ